MMYYYIWWWIDRLNLWYFIGYHWVASGSKTLPSMQKSLEIASLPHICILLSTCLVTERADLSDKPGCSLLSGMMINGDEITWWQADNCWSRDVLGPQNFIEKRRLCIDRVFKIIDKLYFITINSDRVLWLGYTPTLHTNKYMRTT